MSAVKRRPGSYTLSVSRELGRISDTAEAGTATATTRPGLNQVPGGVIGSESELSSYGALFPTVLDIEKAMEAASNRSIPYAITERRPGDAAISVADPSQVLKRLG